MLGATGHRLGAHHVDGATLNIVSTLNLKYLSDFLFTRTTGNTAPAM